MSSLLPGIMLPMAASLSRGVAERVFSNGGGRDRSRRRRKPGLMISPLRAFLSPIMGCAGKSLAAVGLDTCDQAKVRYQSPLVSLVFVVSIATSGLGVASVNSVVCQ